MIDLALKLVESEVRSFLLGRFSNDLIELGPLHDITKPADSTVRPLRITLVRVEEERALKAQLATRRNAEGLIEAIQPELKLNLYILVSGHAPLYDETLRHLSAVVGFFQSKGFFDSANTPQIPAEITQLSVDLHSPSFEELNHLFGMLIAGYRPSLLYKVRLLVVQESTPHSIAPPTRVLNIGGAQG